MDGFLLIEAMGSNPALTAGAKLQDTITASDLDQFRYITWSSAEAEMSGRVDSITTGTAPVGGGGASAVTEASTFGAVGAASLAGLALLRRRRRGYPSLPSGVSEPEPPLRFNLAQRLEP